MRLPQMPHVREIAAVLDPLRQQIRGFPGAALQAPHLPEVFPVVERLVGQPAAVENANGLPVGFGFLVVAGVAIDVAAIGP